jgi:hypothetical protein
MGNEAIIAKRAIIHIGTEKTGTTSLQHRLALSRAVLRQSGVLYPQSAGSKNHTRLVAASLDDNVIDNVKAHIMADRGEDEAELRKKFARDLNREMTEGPYWQTLLLSSELIHSRLHTKTEVERLLSYFEAHVDEIHLVVVLRRQDKLALSRFSTAIRAGHKGVADIFEDLHEHVYISLPTSRHVSDFEHYYDYSSLIARFTPYIPSEHIHIWKYEDLGVKLSTTVRLEQLLNVSLNTFDGCLELNRSMSLAAQNIIARLNAEFPSYLPSGLRNEVFAKLKNQIALEVIGSSRTVDRAKAEAFMARFHQSNAEVAKRTPQQKLFDTSFDDYSITDRNILPDNFEEKLKYYRHLLSARLRPSHYERFKKILNLP